MRSPMSYSKHVVRLLVAIFISAVITLRSVARLISGWQGQSCDDRHRINRTSPVNAALIMPSQEWCSFVPPTGRNKDVHTVESCQGGQQSV